LSICGHAQLRSTRQIGAWIETEFGLVYESRSGLIALLHRLGLEYHKPDTIPRKLDEEKQKAFIESYNKLLNSLTDNEAVVFADDKRMSAITTSTAARDERLADVIQFLAWVNRAAPHRIEDDCPRIAQEQPVPGDRGAGGFLCKAKPLLLQIRAIE
jgi:hypothetical protein